MAKGPVPKRKAYKHGHQAQKPVTQASSGRPADGRAIAPDPDPGWHPRARQYFDSLIASGQARFYEASDWALAMVACDLLTQIQAKMSAALVGEFTRLSTLLLASEGDRRRALVELGDDGVDADEAAAETAMMDAYRRIA